MLTSIILLLLLIILNGFFAGSEIALVSLNNSKMKSMANEGHRGATLVMRLKEAPNKFLSTIQIGVTIASIFSGAFASEAFASELTTWVLVFSDYPEAAIKTFMMFLITLLTAYLMLIFGELVPKRLAMYKPEQFSFFVVYPLWILSRISTPVIKILSVSTNLVLRILGIDPKMTDDEVTEEEITIMVEAGQIDLTEKQMIYNIFAFDNLEISDEMTHRTDVVAIDSEATIDEVMEIVQKERFTRYPVYGGNIDDIIGIIHLRDLLRYLKKNETSHFDIKDVIRKPYYAPESKPTDELFRELQKHNTHMAIVIDEYGGTAGIITMEDLIEKIMGDIFDEHDEEEDVITKVDEDEYLVVGSCDLEGLEEKLSIGIPSEEYDTVSGFVIGQLGKIPTKKDLEHENIEFSFNGYLFSVESVHKRVVSLVRIIKLDQEIEVDDEED